MKLNETDKQFERVQKLSGSIIKNIDLESIDIKNHLSLSYYYYNPEVGDEIYDYKIDMKGIIVGVKSDSTEHAYYTILVKMENGDKNFYHEDKNEFRKLFLISKK